MPKVLIIDDDDDIIDSLTMVLESNGHTVSVKRDTDRIVAEVMRIDPDIIILDVMFPEDPQAGFKAARELRREEKLRDIPVLILSAVNQRSGLGFGFSEQDISEDFLPVDGFLDKPVEPKTLLEKIEQVLLPRDQP